MFDKKPLKKTIGANKDYVETGENILKIKGEGVVNEIRIGTGQSRIWKKKEF